MHQGVIFASKVLQKRQESRLLSQHYQNLKQARPITGFANDIDNMITLNNKKKEMQAEGKYTQIQRQNRLLLQKITNIMNKRRGSTGVDGRVNRSLNSVIRKKQYQSIEVQNAKMLKRLQERRSEYELDKFKKDWRKTKKMIKNITSYPITIDQINDKRKKRTIELGVEQLKYLSKSNPQNQLVKLMLIGTKKFIITIKMAKNKLIILGDLRSQKQLKVIQIQKNEALKFIQSNCNGDINQIFNLLRYNETQQSLYLQSKQTVEENDKLVENKQQKPRPRQKGTARSRKPIFEGIDNAFVDRKQLQF